MSVVWNTIRPGILEGRFTDANEFLSELDPSSAHWGDSANAWIFRGHADAMWPLAPSAYRADTWKDLARPSEPPFVPSAATEGQRMTKEGLLQQEFIRTLEASGINVPLEYRMIGSVPGVGHEKPLALAQHYGLPTRLLDWTRHSATAAYFACLRPKAPAAELAVWALHGEFVNSNPTEEAICQLVLTTRYDNPNLNAQDGLFTLVAPVPAGGLDTKAFPLIDDLLSKLADAKLTLRKGALPMPSPIMRKFVLPRSQDERLMGCLHRRRVTASRVFPGLAGAAMTVRERLQFGVKEPSF